MTAQKVDTGKELRSHFAFRTTETFSRKKTRFMKALIKCKCQTDTKPVCSSYTIVHVCHPTTLNQGLISYKKTHTLKCWKSLLVKGRQIVFEELSFIQIPWSTKRSRYHGQQRGPDTMVNKEVRGRLKVPNSQTLSCVIYLTWKITQTK